MNRFRSRGHLFLEKKDQHDYLSLAGVRHGIFTLTCLRFTKSYKIDTGHKLKNLTHSQRHRGRHREIRKEPKDACFDLQQRRLYRHDHTTMIKKT